MRVAQTLVLYWSLISAMPGFIINGMVVGWSVVPVRTAVMSESSHRDKNGTSVGPHGNRI